MTDHAQGGWTRVDEYFSSLFMEPDSTLAQTLQSSTAAGLPEINVSPNQGKLLHLLVRMSNAKRVLEVGTLGGYSTIWMARGLPADGRLITLELDAKHAKVARANFQQAGVANVVTLLEGAALETMQQLIDEDAGPFDLVFIDADKVNIPHYFTLSMQLARVGTTIIVDNVVRKGAVIDANSTDASVNGVRQFNDLVSADKRVSATAVQTVGVKGYDGLVIMQVLSVSPRLL